MFDPSELADLLADMEENEERLEEVKGEDTESED